MMVCKSCQKAYEDFFRRLPLHAIEAVYVIKTSTDGGFPRRFKVGITSACEVAKRLSTLQIGCPAKLEHVASLDGAAELEKRLHTMLREHRERGEWFRPNPILNGIIRVANQVEEIKRQYYKIVEINETAALWMITKQNQLWRDYRTIVGGKWQLFRERTRKLNSPAASSP